MDFDGTLSLLRNGWEAVMRQTMLDCLASNGIAPQELSQGIDEYIRESTGIQTIAQMKWLGEAIVSHNGKASDDPWHYKKIYTSRLMDMVIKRLDDLETGRLQAAGLPERALLLSSCD